MQVDWGIASIQIGFSISLQSHSCQNVPERPPTGTSKVQQRLFLGTCWSDETGAGSVKQFLCNSSHHSEISTTSKGTCMYFPSDGYLSSGLRTILRHDSSLGPWCQTPFYGLDIKVTSYPHSACQCVKAQVLQLADSYRIELTPM